MSKLYSMTPKMLMSIYMQQMVLQEQLVQAQKQIIELQEQLAKTVPPTPADNDVFWHKASGGVLSTEAANSPDLTTARAFLDWNRTFAREYIKPYVNPKVYTEVVNQMTRGLPEHVANLQTKSEITKSKPDLPQPKGQIIQMEMAFAGVGYAPQKE